VGNTFAAAVAYAGLITSAEVDNHVTARFVAMRGRQRGGSSDQGRRDDGHFGSLLEVAKIGHLLLHRLRTPDGGIRPLRMPLG